MEGDCPASEVVSVITISFHCLQPSCTLLRANRLSQRTLRAAGGNLTDDLAEHLVGQRVEPHDQDRQQDEPRDKETGPELDACEGLGGLWGAVLGTLGVE